MFLTYIGLRKQVWQDTKCSVRASNGISTKSKVVSNSCVAPLHMSRVTKADNLPLYIPISTAIRSSQNSRKIPISLYPLRRECTEEERCAKMRMTRQPSKWGKMNRGEMNQQQSIKNATSRKHERSSKPSHSASWATLGEMHQRLATRVPIYRSFWREIDKERERDRERER